VTLRLTTYFCTTRDRSASVLFRRDQLLRANHENIYETRKPAFSSLLPYHTLIQALVICMNKIWEAKHKIVC
jgi:hypothetical protein